VQKNYFISCFKLASGVINRSDDRNAFKNSYDVSFVRDRALRDRAVSVVLLPVRVVHARLSADDNRTLAIDI